MGQSTSVSNLAQQNQDFNNYLTSCTANLNAQASPYQAQFESEVASYYSQNNWDQILLAEGGYSNYQQQDEVSSGIDKLIGTIAQALFSGGSAPSGTNVASSATIGSVLTDIGELENLAVTVATSFINQVLNLLSDTTTTEFYNAFKSQSLAPGLTLHVWQYGNAFQHTDYFNNQYIIGTVISYKLIFSTEQFAAESNIGDLEAQQTFIESAQQTLATRQNAYNTELASPNPSMQKLEFLQTLLTMAKENYKDCLNALNAFIAKRTPATSTSTGMAE